MITPPTILAAELLPAFSVVTATGYVADSADVGQLNKVVGVVRHPVTPGSYGEVADTGEIVNPDWRFTPGATIYLNGEGLSETAPVSGWVQAIGIARNTNTPFTDTVILRIEPATLIEVEEDVDVPVTVTADDDDAAAVANDLEDLDAKLRGLHTVLAGHGIELPAFENLEEFAQ